MMKKTLIILALCLIGALPAVSQEITAYDTDSTAYYNAAYNPNDFGQAPVKGRQARVQDGRGRLHADVRMGAGFGGGGSYEFVSPTLEYDLSKKWSLNFGMGLAYSTMKWKSLPLDEGGQVSYQNMRAVSNYYSAGATYHASDRLSLYGDLIYVKSVPVGGDGHCMYDGDRYMATFGATYNITKSLSVGFEVRQSRGFSPYASRYGIIYNNPYSPW